MHKAEEGDGDAQADVAEMYATGRDVPQDFERSAFWREQAAEQGIARAENALGKQYATGLGVPQDYVLGFMWLSLGASSGHDLLVETKDNLMSFLTASQINEAQRMAREFSAGRRAGIQ